MDIYRSMRECTIEAIGHLMRNAIDVRQTRLPTVKPRFE